MVSLSNHEATAQRVRPPSWFDKLTMKATETAHFQSGSEIPRAGDTPCGDAVQRFPFWERRLPAGS